MLHCPYCGKKVIQGDNFCHSCRRTFEDPLIDPSQKSQIKASSEKIWDTYWHETNSATHFVFIIFLLFSFISNFIRGNLGGMISAIIGALAAYYWWGPWMVDFAKEHNRNINWAYFYGLAFGLIGLIFYYIYVKVSTDPEITNKVTSQYNPKKESVIKTILMALGVIFILILLLAFGFGILGSISKPLSDASTQTIPTIQPVKFSPIIPNTYKKFINNDLRFSIYLPPNWQTEEIDSSASSTLSSDDVLKDVVMPKIVYLTDKNIDPTQGMIMIYGMDIRNSAFSYGTIESFNDGFIEGVQKGLSKSKNTEIILASKGVPSYYGDYETLTNSITYTTPYGIPCHIQINTVKNGSIFYVIYYAATAEIYKNQIATVDTIVHTFMPF
jgi:hypothetical protein